MLERVFQACPSTKLFPASFGLVDNAQVVRLQTLSFSSCFIYFSVACWGNLRVLPNLCIPHQCSIDGHVIGRIIPVVQKPLLGYYCVIEGAHRFPAVLAREVPCRIQTKVVDTFEICLVARKREEWWEKVSRPFRNERSKNVQICPNTPRENPGEPQCTLGAAS